METQGFSHRFWWLMSFSVHNCCLLPLAQFTMTSPWLLLEKDVFTPLNERLLEIVHIWKTGKKRKGSVLCVVGEQLSSLTVNWWRLCCKTLDYYSCCYSHYCLVLSVVKDLEQTPCNITYDVVELKCCLSIVLGKNFKSTKEFFLKLPDFPLKHFWKYYISYDLCIPQCPITLPFKSRLKRGVCPRSEMSEKHLSQIWNVWKEM